MPLTIRPRTLRGTAAPLLPLCAAVALAALPAAAKTYYVSTTGTSTAAGTADDPLDIKTGFGRAGNSANEIVILPGTYELAEPVAANGAGSVVRGSTGNPADVVLDAQGQFHVMRIAGNILVHSLTVANGVTNSYNGGTSSSGAAGIRLGSDKQETRSVVSNCVVRGCYNSSSTSQACGAVVMFKNSLLVDSWITNNTAYYVCAGVNVGQANADATIRGCVIADNAPNAGNNGTLHGIGLCLGFEGGTLTVENTEIRGNVSASGGAGGGFAIRQNGCSALFRNCVFSGNSNANGGAVGVNGSSSASFEGCTFEGNTASKIGGVARIYNGASLNFTDCTFTGNESPTGGAIFQEGNSEHVATRVFAKDCVFDSNVATNGGAVAVTGISRFVADGCTFSGNRTLYTANPSGDAITAGGGAINCVNTAAKGGVWGGCYVTNSIFTANTSKTCGGAVSHTLNSAVAWEFVNCKFLDNQGVKWGGAVCLRDSSENENVPQLFRQCLFAGNSVISIKASGSGTDSVANAGALYFVSYSDPVVDSCTFAENTATGNGAAIYHRWGGSIVNTVIANNLIGGEPDTSDWGYNGGNSHNCVSPDSNAKIQSTYFKVANGNIFADPLFVDAANGDYRLSENSPCKGKGLNEAWMADAQDLAGLKHRIYGENVDIGAYEIFIPAAFTMVIR